MNSIVQDLRLALARLRSKPGHFAVVALVLAMGIGASTAIFALVDATLFRPFDLPQSDRLVRINTVDTPADRGDPKNHSNSSFPAYLDYRAETSLFTGLAAYSDTIALHVGEGDTRPTRVNGALVTGNYFDVLRSVAKFGRTLMPSDDVVRNGHPVAVISEGLSQTFFGGPDPTGREVRINGRVFTVVGAMASTFTGVSLDARPSVWLPMSMRAAATPEWSVPEPGRPFVDPLDNRRFSWLDIVGRLAPGVTMEGAQARLDALGKHRQETLPDGKNESFPALVAASEAAIDFGGPNDTRRLSWILLGLVSLLLLLACADAASLQLAQGDGRRAEIATKAALGASRRQLIRQLLAESLVISVVATALGVMFAVGLRQALIATMPSGFAIPMSAVVPVLALRPLMFSTVLALAVSIVFGLAPALRGSKADLITALRSRTGSSAPRSRLRDSLVAAQMALSTILLVGAGLLIHSLERAANTEPGFDPAHALIARVDLSRQGYSPETGARFYEDLLREVKAIPGVSGSALSRHVPVNRSGMRVTISVPGYERKPDERMNVDYTMVSPGFFKAIGAPAIKGRDFDERDGLGAPKVAIINEALARKYFAGRDPIGQPLTDVGVTSEATIIVGIAPDMKLRTLREEPRPALYVALSQNYMSSLALVIRSEGDSSLTMAQVYEVVGRLDKELPLFGVSTLEKQLGAAVDQEKSMAVLLSGFGLLAVILASSGLGALVFQQAQSRQREFGVRLALGAGPRDVLSIVLSHGAKLALAGSLAGLAASLFLAPIIEGFLFQVGPRDPLTLAGVAATLVIVTLVASALPALRASRTNPAMALRGE